MASALISALMLGALLHMPYGYYTFLRVLTCLFAGAMGYLYFLCDDNFSKTLALIFTCVAIMFNPIVPIHMPREVWSYINIVASVLFAVNVYLIKKTFAKSQR